MSWFAHLQNPRAIAAYYPVAPRLEGVTVHSLAIKRDGPTAEIVFEPADFPASPSPRWPAGSNRCQVTLQVFGLTDVELSCWGTGITGDLVISRGDEAVSVRLTGEAAFRLKGEALFVAGVSGYIDDDA